jgi:hypothetical protein
MTETNLTLTDIATFAAIAGAAVSVFGTGLKLLVEYLTAKFGNRMTPQEQSDQCRIDHDKLGGILTAQNANIARMIEMQNKQLEQNGEQIKALSDANHAAQLRHQIVLNELERIKDAVKKD